MSYDKEERQEALGLLLYFVLAVGLTVWAVVSVHRLANHTDRMATALEHLASNNNGKAGESVPTIQAKISGSERGR